jgi:predicted ATPase/signal transduction histidine kinase
MRSQDGDSTLVRRFLPVSAVIAAGDDIAGSLMEMHARGVLHLSLCPDAIQLEPRSGRARLLTSWVPAADAAGTAPRLERLAWIAPEQTGRIGRAADERSDLYSLGLVLHRLLTGTPVLDSDDPLEWIHWHLAGVAPDPASVNPDVPAALSAVVMKLLAKSADERYQSASALSKDFRRCGREWAATGRIEPFALGQGEPGRRLAVPGRLYGRDGEVRALLDALATACEGEGKAVLLLVAGYAGIGKTALIEQLYRPILRRRGYFIAGKFDQVARGVPFGALIQAFRDLVHQLLTESDADLQAWRLRLGEALGGNGGVIAEVIPEIEFILGTQRAPPPLGAIEAQNRFQLVLRNFVAALAAPTHPLVIFLDDLQWADAATLGLLEPLLAAGGLSGLLVIGAYRDNELEAAPQLVRSIAAVEAGGGALRRITLGPLALADLVQLVADTFAIAPEAAEPLARLVFDKTGGNPFFVTQFLKTLEREEHVRFDEASAQWRWNIEEVSRAPLADNVVDLMTRRLTRLAQRTQDALTLAACIGNRFEESTLARVSEQSTADTAGDLADALREGLVVRVASDDPASRMFAFLHDRVQQAAYALVPESRRQRLHLSVGRLLRRHKPSGEIDSGLLFDIVHHLDLALPLIVDARERLAVAALNLEAGRRAKSATAHESALAMLTAGCELLEGAASGPESDSLSFELGLELAESRYLCGRFEAAHGLMAELTARARNPIDGARVVRLRSVQYENMARYADALENARAGLALFDLRLPAEEWDKAAALENEIALIDRLRADRPIAALADMPTMIDPSIRIVMAMLTDVWSAAYILGDPTLARLISATLVRLSLEHGNVEESAYGYVTHAITVGPVRGGYAAADEWGLLALAVNQRFGDARRRAKIHQQFQAHVAPWCRPFQTCIAYAREACRSGLESGDFLYAAYGAGTEPWAAMLATQDLAQFERDYAPAVELIDRLKNPAFADSVRVLLGWARALQGRTADPLSVGDASFDEEAYVLRYAANPFFSTIHAVVRLQLSVLLGSVAEALHASRLSARTAHVLEGTIWPVVHDFWHALACAAAAHDLAAADRSELLQKLRSTQARFATLAGCCAVNYRCQSLLLGAEIARLEGAPAEAIACCEDAIEFAAANALLPYQALSHEMCAGIHRRAGRVRLAGLHLAAAKASYGAWGATAKVAALEREHPAAESEAARLDPAARSPGRDAAAAVAIDHDRAPSHAATTDGLDLHSAMKAAQAIAAEVEPGALLERLMRIAIENAGAERGALVIEGEPGPIAWVDPVAGSGARRLEAFALETSREIPLGIINYVRRTGESLVLAEPEIERRFGDEPWVAARRPRSLVCVPVQHQGRRIGALYLDNSRVAGAFTAARVEVLHILAAQATIALENARLVSGLRSEISERRTAQESLSAALVEVERLKQEVEAENSYLRRELIANISHDLRTPLVSMRGYLELLAAKADSLTEAERSSFLSIALRQTENLSSLVDQLFELAKLEFKGTTLNVELLAPGDLANDVLQKFRLLAEQRNVRLAAVAAPGLPQVQGDLRLLERVFDNLIGNALQHTPEGGSVSVRLGPHARGLCVEVEDTGRGIAASDLPFVFDRHFRASGSAQHSPGGAGLGLAISRRILELHRSALEVQSQEGIGTRFSFCLAALAADRSTPECTVAGQPQES